MVLGFWFLMFIFVIGILAYHRSSLNVFMIGTITFLIISSLLLSFSWVSNVIILLLYVCPLCVFSITPIRQKLLSQLALKFYQKAKPSMSKTEKEALDSGTVGWEAELFSGQPDWDKLLNKPSSHLTSEEQEFLDNQVQTLCEKINEWEINLSPAGLKQEIWDYLKNNQFFSMIIPKKYGGLAFSARAHSEVITKIASANGSAGTVTSVPNSLGPAELLLHYGSEEQKNYYLPRLASGEEIPCFALTSTLAGSDAGAMQDFGIVCQCQIDGKDSLGIRLNFSKRYITLSPVATLLGLAFKLYDPDHLLGEQEDLGITCALIPVNTPGVETGRYHLPIYSAFPNGPVCGKDVIISIDQVIGGQEQVGCGWRMLMECLANGRGVSIPSMINGYMKRLTLSTGAYARIRRQFNTHIGEFEGVSSVIARMVANTFKGEAMRCFITSALDNGERPAVAAAISKYHTTEIGRQVAIDAMDIHGGRAICMGPSNYVVQSYVESPIGVTVEGANILTRNMMIFGQGVMRCHPFVLDELTASANANSVEALKGFDRAFWGHVGFYLSNCVRSLVLSLGGSFWVKSPVSGRLAKYYKLFTRFSANLAWLADSGLLIVGASLKRRESLSARLGDLLSYLYIGSSVLKYYDEQANETLLPVIEYICHDLCYQMELTVSALIKNYPFRFKWLLKFFVLPRGRKLSPPTDNLSSKVAQLVMAPSHLRDRFSMNTYMTPKDNNPSGQMNAALDIIISATSTEKKLHKALRKNMLHGYTYTEWVMSAVESHVLTQDEANQLMEVDLLRQRLIAVDDFSKTDLLRMYQEAQEEFMSRPSNNSNKHNPDNNNNDKNNYSNASADNPVEF